ncbi:MAG: hypothetical protein FJX46_04340 [Alphaproteobacteria bacterium]|nr:hypothetical protein [Alphaproteobacteria bacterium]
MSGNPQQGQSGSSTGQLQSGGASSAPQIPQAEHILYTVGAGHCRVLGNFAVQAFVQVLAEKIRERGGAINFEDLKDSLAKFAAAAGPLEVYYKKSFEDCFVSHERARELIKRQNAFSRMLVHNFSEMFPRTVEQRADPNAITRDILPAFFTAMKLILGDDKVRLFERETAEILDAVKARLMPTGTLANLWKEYYKDPKLYLLNVRVLYMVAAYFKRWDVRKQWFISVMNNEHLTQSLASNAYVVVEGRSVGTVRFTENKFYLLLRQFFLKLNPDRLSEDAKKMLRAEFGTEIAQVISSLYFNLTGAKKAR